MYYDFKIIFITLFCLAGTTFGFSPVSNLECNRTTYMVSVGLLNKFKR